MDEETVALLPDDFDVVAQKHNSAVALSVQYLSVLIQTIKQVLLLVSYVREIPQHPLNVYMEMFDLLMDLEKQKEEWKSVLTATGLWLVIVAATGILLQLT